MIMREKRMKRARKERVRKLDRDFLGWKQVFVSAASHENCAAVKENLPFNFLSAMEKSFTFQYCISYNFSMLCQKAELHEREWDGCEYVIFKGKANIDFLHQCRPTYKNKSKGGGL